MNKEYKFTLQKAGSAEYELSESPMGWEKFGEKYDRHELYHGVFGSISTNLRFSRQYVGYGGKLLYDAFIEKGTKADVTLKMYELDHSDFVSYDLFYTGKADFNPGRFSYNHDYVDITFNQNSEEIQLVANDEIEYEIPYSNTVTYRGIPFFTNSKYSMNLNNEVTESMSEILSEKNYTTQLNLNTTSSGLGGDITNEYYSDELTFDAGYYTLYGFSKSVLSLIINEDPYPPAPNRESYFLVTYNIEKYNGSAWEYYSNIINYGSANNPNGNISLDNIIKLSDIRFDPGIVYRIKIITNFSWVDITGSSAYTQALLNNDIGIILAPQTEGGRIDVDFKNVVTLSNNNTQEFTFSSSNNKFFENKTTTSSVVVVEAPKATTIDNLTIQKLESGLMSSFDYHYEYVCEKYNDSDVLVDTYNFSDGTGSLSSISTGVTIENTNNDETSITVEPRYYLKAFFRIYISNCSNVLSLTNSGTTNTTTLYIDGYSVSLSVGDTSERCLNVANAFNGLASKLNGTERLSSSTAFEAILQKYYITSGKSLRKLKTDTFTLSFRNLFKSINSKFNACMYFGNGGVIIDSKDKVYQNVLIADLGEVSNFTATPMSVYFNSINCGQKKPVYNYPQAIYEIQSLNKYFVDFIIKNELDLTSPYNWDSIGVELARRNNINLSKNDTSMDDLTFISEVSSNQTVKCSAFTGFPFIDYYYNPNATNRKALLNWMNYWAIFYPELIDNPILKYLSSDANNNVYNGSDYELTNIDISSITPLFVPMQLDFTALYPPSVRVATQLNRNGYYSFTNMGTSYKGFINSIDGSEYEGQAKFSLIKCPF